MNTKRTRRACVVGVGYWGKHLARNLADVGGLGAICDANPATLEWAESRYPGLSYATNLGAVLDNDDLDAIVVATPPRTHYAVAREALLAGRHVLIEKPFTCDRKHAEDLIEIAESRGLVLMGGFTFLYNAAVRKVRDYIRQGRLGNTYYVLSQRLNLGKVRSDVDVWWNLGPHDISIVLDWFDAMPVEVSGWAVSYLQKDVSDIAFVSLKFDDGRTAFIHVSWLDPTKRRGATVVGSGKMVVYDEMSADEKVRLYDHGVDRLSTDGRPPSFENFGEYQLLLRAGDIEVPKLEFDEPLRVECEHFLDCITGAVTCLSDGQVALKILRVLEAGDESIRMGGRAIPIQPV